jgi:hypothetical protein
MEDRPTLSDLVLGVIGVIIIIALAWDIVCWSIFLASQEGVDK